MYTRDMNISSLPTAALIDAIKHSDVIRDSEVYRNRLNNEFADRYHAGDPIARAYLHDA